MMSTYPADEADGDGSSVPQNFDARPDANDDEQPVDSRGAW